MIFLVQAVIAFALCSAASFFSRSPRSLLNMVRVRYYVETITRNMLSWFLLKNPHPLVWVVDNHNQILVQNITVIRHTLMWDSKVSNVMSSIIN